MADRGADHEVSLTCAVQLRTMLRREGANGNENTQATEAIRFREMGNLGQIIAIFGGVDPIVFTAIGRELHGFERLVLSHLSHGPFPPQP